MKSAKRFWADGSPVAGQQFEYAHDDIGNRTTGKSGGDVVGGSLRTTTDTTDADSLLTQRSNPRQYEVQGAARIGTEVKVNGVVATRQGEYFRYEGTASGTPARWLDHSLSLNGSTLISGRKKYVPPQTESVGHDIVGNRIQDGRWEMAWDGENRLIDVRTRDAAVSEGVPKQRLRYTYDPDGRLIERRRFSWSAGDWVLSETTRYLNDGWQCVGEFNGSNTLQRRQVWGLDLDGSRGGMGGIGGLLWIASQANGTHYATSDGSGNVVGLFDTSGSISARYVYSPFGELLQLSGGAIATENPWRFSSKRQDPTTDWIHYEYRIYDPMSGRWLSRDPIGEAGGENLYGFVGNNPVDRLDAFGLQEVTGEPVRLLLPPPGGFRPSSPGPLTNWLWEKPDPQSAACPPRHFMGAADKRLTEIPQERILTPAERYHFDSFLTTFGASGLCNSPIGHRLAEVNMQLINHAGAIPSRAGVEAFLNLGASAINRIGQCIGRVRCSGPAQCILEGGQGVRRGFELMVHPFSDGGTHITTSVRLAVHADSATFGGPSGLFIAPTRQIDSLLATGASSSQIEVALGLKPNALAEGALMRLDVANPFTRNLCLPTSGNMYFRPGTGLTWGGLNEGVITSPLKTDPSIVLRPIL